MRLIVIFAFSVFGLVVPASVASAQGLPKSRAFIACNVEAMVGTKTKKEQVLIYQKRSAKSPVVGRLPVEEGIVVTIEGAIRGWVMIVGAKGSKGKKHFAKRGWAWAPNFIQKAVKDTTLFRGPRPGTAPSGIIPKGARLGLRSCMGKWTLVRFRNRRAWFAPNDQCPARGVSC